MNDQVWSAGDSIGPSEALTEFYRRRLRAATNACPTCGHSNDEGGVRALAASIGIGHSTLWRFLKGKDMTGRNLDKIDAWLRAAPDPLPSALHPVDAEFIAELRADGETELADGVERAIRNEDPLPSAQVAFNPNRHSSDLDVYEDNADPLPSAPRTHTPECGFTRRQLPCDCGLWSDGPWADPTTGAEDGT